MTQPLSWIHFGDLHISNAGEQNHIDFGDLIAEANRHMRGDIAFGLLPGDNADDGEADQYRIVKACTSLCEFPIEAIPGDHDKARGNLELFKDCFPGLLPRSFTNGLYHFVFLNSVADWAPPLFGLGAEQMKWLHQDVTSAHRSGQRIVVFMHAYPSEHNEAAELAKLFRQCGVSLVEMGHTHYNELANDGQTIYAATRSTGQIEEGSVGFSVTTLDGIVVSWKFKPLGDWPLVVITSPSDHRLITVPSDPSHLVRGVVQIRARAWGEGVHSLTMTIDGEASQSLQPIDADIWVADWNSSRVSDGPHLLAVTATAVTGQSTDRVTILVNQRGDYEPSERHRVDFENALDEWPEKHIVGTQLGPNENGRHWPSRHDRKHGAQ